MSGDMESDVRLGRELFLYFGVALHLSKMPLLHQTPLRSQNLSAVMEFIKLQPSIGPIECTMRSYAMCYWKALEQGYKK
jgi:hypothetical protein